MDGMVAALKGGYVPAVGKTQKGRRWGRGSATWCIKWQSNAQGIMGPESRKPNLLEVETKKESHPRWRHSSGRRHAGWKAAWRVQGSWTKGNELKGMTENRAGESGRPSSWEVLSLSAMCRIYPFILSSGRNHWQIINKEMWSDLYLRQSLWWG